MSRPRTLLPALVGTVGAIAVTAGLTLGLSFPPLLAIGFGAVLGTGGALLTAGVGGREEEQASADAEQVAALLAGSIRSTTAIEPALRTLSTRELWEESPLDENLLTLCANIRGVATIPAVAGRGYVDGDIRMLHAIATEYLPTIARLAQRHDEMYRGFSEKSRKDVRANVADLNEQSLILMDAITRIESDILQGSSRDVTQHTEYLRARFNELGPSSGGLDFDRAFQQLEKDTETQA